jgi:hypothetical protein
MKAILSTTPTLVPAPIRHLVGTQLLLIVQAALVLRSAAVPDGPLRGIMIVTALFALAGLVAAIRGEPRQDPKLGVRS